MAQETFPKLGMTYNQVALRLKTDSKYKQMPNARNSLLRQCALCEGEHAAQELNREISSTVHFHDNCSVPKKGYNPIYASRFDSIKWK